MRTFIVTKKQLNEYVENKKAEKVFTRILTDIHNNKYLNENISKDDANQSIINIYIKRKLITPRVNEMLMKYGIINEKSEIL